MVRVAREEGFTKLFSGADWATGRAVGRQLVGNKILFHFPIIPDPDDHWPVVFL